MSKGQNNLNAVLIKPAGPDCNISCEYCFYIEKGRLFSRDTHRMSDAVLALTMSQMMSLPGSHVGIGWQGGEPTLMGLRFFERAVAYQQRFGHGQCVGNSLQTNGLLIDRAWAGFLARYNFLVGLSLDGPRHLHDHHRTRRKGGGTFEQVVDAGKLLQDTGVMVNALCVVTDYSVRYPREIYCFLTELGYSHLQFIPCVEPSPLGQNDVSPFSVTAKGYGEFLVEMFDLWIRDFEDGYPTTSIRFFDALLNRYMSRAPSDCTLLETCGNYLVVEHNGDLFPCDFFVDEPYRLGNVRTHDMNAVFKSDAMRAFGHCKARLPSPCIGCEWVDVCCGGCPKDRPPGAPSYLCEGFEIFFDHAHESLREKAQWIVEREVSVQQRDTREAIRQGTLRVGRNDPCPCGSGRKFKKCCLIAD